MLRPFSAHTFGQNVCIPQGSPLAGYAFTRQANQLQNVLSPGAMDLSFTRATEAWAYEGEKFKKFLAGEPVTLQQGLFAGSASYNFIKDNENPSQASWTGAASVSSSGNQAPVAEARNTYILRDNSPAQQLYKRATSLFSSLTAPEKVEKYNGFFIGKKVEPSMADGEYLSCLRIFHIEQLDVDSSAVAHDHRVIFDARTGRVRRTHLRTVYRYPSGGAFRLWEYRDELEETTPFGPEIQLANGFYAIPIGLPERGFDPRLVVAAPPGFAGRPGIWQPPRITQALNVEIYPAYTFDDSEYFGANSITGSLEFFGLHLGKASSLQSYIPCGATLARRNADQLTTAITGTPAEVSLYSRMQRDEYNLDFLTNVIGVAVFSGQSPNGSGDVPYINQAATLESVRADYQFDLRKAVRVFASAKSGVQALELKQLLGNDFTASLATEVAPFAVTTTEAERVNIAGAYQTANAVRASILGQAAITQDEVVAGPLTFTDLYVGDSSAALAASKVADALIRSVFIYSTALSAGDLANASGSCQN